MYHLTCCELNEIVKQSEKQYSFRHILKSSASMYENTGSQLFRTTTGFDKSGMWVRDVLEIINFTGSSTWFSFNKYVHKHLFSVSWVRKAILKKYNNNL